MTVTQLDHLNVTVENVAESVKWYGRVFGFERVEDLPGGGPRLSQRAEGIAATLVAGQVTLREGEPTGALPGRLLRNRLAQR